MRSCARRRLFSPKRSSTANRRDGGLHRPTPGGTWGRADLQAVADRPVDVLRTQGPGSGPWAVAGAGEAGPGTVSGSLSRVERELPGVRRQEGVASASTGRPWRGSLHGRAVDEAA